MRTGKGIISELILLDGQRHARISCPTDMIPVPGKFLLASDGSEAPLPVSLFYTDSAPQGFLAAPIPDRWAPGTEIFLRGPLGNGFSIPPNAQKICLAAFDIPISRLRGMIQPALKQNAAVVLVVAEKVVESLPDEVEIHPMESLAEILAWADYAATEISRESLPALNGQIGELGRNASWRDVQIFIETPVPCGGLADCGVCAITTKSGWKLVCKDGPVFSFDELM